MDLKILFVLVIGSSLIMIGSVFLRMYIRRKEKVGLNYIIGLYRTARFKDCKEYTEKYLKIYPNSKNGWLMLGNVGLQTFDLKLAEKGYSKALEIDNSCDKTLTGMGALMRYRQQFNDAEDYYYKALKINPNNYKAKSSLMLLELYKGNNDIAIALGEDSIKDGLDNIDVGMLGNLVIAYHINNDFEKRDDLFEYLKNKEYADLFYIMTFLDGKVKIEDIMEMNIE